MISKLKTIKNFSFTTWLLIVFNTLAIAKVVFIFTASFKKYIFSADVLLYLMGTNKTSFVYCYFVKIFALNPLLIIVVQNIIYILSVSFLYYIFIGKVFQYNLTKLIFSIFSIFILLSTSYIRYTNTILTDSLTYCLLFITIACVFMHLLTMKNIYYVLIILGCVALAFNKLSQIVYIFPLLVLHTIFIYSFHLQKKYIIISTIIIILLPIVVLKSDNNSKAVYINHIFTPKIVMEKSQSLASFMIKNNLFNQDLINNCLQVTNLEDKYYFRMCNDTKKLNKDKVYKYYIKYLVLHPQYLIQPLLYNYDVLYNTTLISNKKHLQKIRNLYNIKLFTIRKYRPVVRYNEYLHQDKKNSLRSIKVKEILGYHLSFYIILFMAFLGVLYYFLGRKNIYESYNINSNLYIKLILYSIGLLFIGVYTTLFLGQLDFMDVQRHIMSSVLINRVALMLIITLLVDLVLHKLERWGKLPWKHM